MNSVREFLKYGDIRHFFCIKPNRMLIRIFTDKKENPKKTKSSYITTHNINKCEQ